MEKSNKIIHICKICNKETKYFKKHLKYHHPEIKDIENYYLKFIDPLAGKCKTCGNKTTFMRVHSGFREFCSDICATKNPEIQKRRMLTLTKNLQKKYGSEVINVSQIPGVQKKVRETYHKTVKEKYGEQFEFTSQVPEVKEKFKKIHANRPKENKKENIILFLIIL